MGCVFWTCCVFEPALTQPQALLRLWHPKSKVPVGFLTLWVEIHPTSESRRLPPVTSVKLRMVEPEEYEVRVIVWKTKDVLGQIDGGGIIDMFIECCLGKSDKQSTDTHFRSEDGEASFNWRMKFDVTLPARGEGVGFLYLQCWDLDMLVNELLCESIFDLSVHLEEAVVKYQTTRMPYNCFITPPTKAEKKRRAEKLKQKAKLDKEKAKQAAAAAKAKGGDPKKEEDQAAAEPLLAGEEKKEEEIVDVEAPEAKEGDAPPAPEGDAPAPAEGEAKRAR